MEYVPGHKMTTAFPEDTWGLSRRFGQFVVETLLDPARDHQTALKRNAYYDPIGWTTRLMNLLFLRRMMVRRACKTISGIKRLAELRQTN